jgi:hypothetical protein
MQRQAPKLCRTTMNQYIIFAVLSSLLVLIPTAQSFSVSPAPAVTIISRHGGYRYENTADNAKQASNSLKLSRPLRAESSSKGTNEGSPPATPTKVQTMASFLVTQLLEKAMLEASKENSKLSEGDALALMETLQNAGEAKTAQENILKEDPPAPSPDDEAVKDGDALQVDAVEEIETPIVEELADKTVALPEKEDPVAVAEKEIETPIVEEEPKEDASLRSKDASETMAQKEKFQRSLLGARIKNDAAASTSQPKPEATAPESVLAEEDATPSPPAAPATSPSVSSLPAVAPRIPDVISKDFGKPLEVTASNVPALRESSVPQKVSPFIGVG